MDSTLLLHLAREAWDRPPLAVSFISPLMTDEEKPRIRELTDRLRVPLKTIKSRSPLDPALRTNPVDRCYWCKKNREALIQTLIGLGFTFITLDLQGLRSGSLNALINAKITPQAPGGTHEG